MATKNGSASVGGAAIENAQASLSSDDIFMGE